MTTFAWCKCGICNVVGSDLLIKKKTNKTKQTNKQTNKQTIRNTIVYIQSFACSSRYMVFMCLLFHIIANLWGFFCPADFEVLTEWTEQYWYQSRFFILLMQDMRTYGSPAHGPDSLANVSFKDIIVLWFIYPPVNVPYKGASWSLQNMFIWSRTCTVLQ